MTDYRLPPHAPQAEQGVISCILPDAGCMAEAIERLKGKAEVFYDLRNQTIFDAMLGLYDARTPIDVLTLRQALKDGNKLEQIGGDAYLSSLPDAAPSPANLSSYTATLSDKYLLRRMLQVCAGATSRIYSREDEVEALLSQIETDVLSIRHDHKTGGVTPFKKLIQEAISTIEDFHQRGGVIAGVTTGLPDLDKLLWGLQPGDVFVIAARPSIGKTSLACGIAEHVAADLGLPVGFFSLEMTQASLAMKMLCSRARVSIKNIREGFIVERDFPKLTSAAGKLSKAPIYIDDTSGLSVMELRARARRMSQQYGIRLLVIDYLQLLHSTSRRVDNRQQEVADISTNVKTMAKELAMPVILIAQLNREVERSGGRPKMSQIRESGVVEADADIIGLLFKPEAEDDGQNQRQDAVPVTLIIAKQRNGATGDVDLTFLKSYTRFESAARVSDDDVPQQTNMPYNDP